jgi:hypothetical protein
VPHSGTQPQKRLAFRAENLSIQLTDTISYDLGLGAVGAAMRRRKTQVRFSFA